MGFILLGHLMASELVASESRANMVATQCAKSNNHKDLIMKKYMMAMLYLILLAVSPAKAIEVNEIIDGYYQNIGGAEAWNKLQGFKMTGEFNQGGMKFPFEFVTLKDGKQYIKFDLQGKSLKQGVFNGETLWSTNFMTMKAEKADAESTANQKLNNNDFPSDLLNYKKNGYKAELLGKETVDGTETYKVKLEKEPVMVDGKKVADVIYYYFDVESLVPLVSEAEIHSGPMKGKIGQTKLSDYQEVDGLYFPFSITQGLKNGPSASMMIKKIVLNPKVAASEFDMPVVAPEIKKTKKNKD